MSEYILKFIPKDPVFIPSNFAQEKIKEFLCSNFSKADDIKVRVEENIEFIDQGENFERVVCPDCERQIDMEWWQESMGKASEDDFKCLSITMPCCGTCSSLNDLKYEWPAGFGKFIIEIFNPNKKVDKECFILIEDILGCEIKKIIACY